LPSGSIFYHTHGYFLRHRPITTAYGNDFASWVAVHVRDQVLAERLAVINPFEFASLEAIREELLSVVHDHLAHLSRCRAWSSARRSTFSSRTSWEVPLGPAASRWPSFRQGLAEVDSSAIYYHMVEARARWAGAPAISPSGCAPRSA